MEKVESNKAMGRLYSTQRSINSFFLVDSSFIVDYNLKICSCKKAFEFGIPCSHFCSVVLFLREDPVSFVERFFLFSNYLNSYAKPILHLITINLSKDDVLSPEVRRRKGRPGIIRFRSPMKH